MRRRPVVGSDVRAGDLLLRLQGDEASNGWLLAGPGWIPTPRVDPLTANAQWVITYCPDCDKHTASLRTTMPLRAHQEVVVRSSPAPDVDTILFPYEVTFDGGARYVDAGAGPEQHVEKTKRRSSACKNRAGVGVSLLAQLLELGGVERHVKNRLCNGCNTREARKVCTPHRRRGEAPPSFKIDA